MPNCLKCKGFFPFWIKIEGKRKNLGSRKFCLECSPFGSKNTRDITKPRPEDVIEKLCSRCGNTKPRDQFYFRRSKGREKVPHAMCKSCTNGQQRETKKWAVEYKGGKCEDCGYDKCQSALEFHHLDPTQKDFMISRAKYYSDEESRVSIARELDKCAILCSNCHRERHARIRGVL